MKFEISDEYFSEEELKNTPDRYKRFIKEWMVDDKKFQFTMFENTGMDEMIMITEIIFYSLCSHHILPFFGLAHFAYIPDKKICGISKIPRAIDYFAHKPNIQERLTIEILNFLVKELKPHWAMIILEAEHLCMSMRGIKKPGHKTMTNAIYENPKTKLPLKNCKEEFIRMVRR